MQIPIKSITKGSNLNVSPLVHPIDQPYLMNGCSNTWRIGAVTKDPGYNLVDAQIHANKSILGLYNFRQVPGTEKMLATLNDATGADTELWYKTSAGAWTEIGAAQTAWAGLTGMNVEMESFIGYCFFVGYNGTSFLPVGSLTDTTFSTITNVTSMPQAKFIKRYNGKIYVANCRTGGTNYPFRVYNSSFPTAAAITWTLTTDLLDVDYSEEVTGMETAFNNLIVFTEYQTYMFDGSSWTARWAQGCSAHRTIKKYKSYLVWCDFDGVQISTGGQPQNISGEIDILYKAGNPRNYFSEIVGEQYFLYLGNITVGDESYSNLVAVFDIGKSIWWVRELGSPMTTFAKFNNAGKLRLFMGNNNGQIFNKGQYIDGAAGATGFEATLLKSDNGSDISSSIELAPFHLDNLNKFKKLNELILFADRPKGVKVYARALDSTSRIITPYETIGELTAYINSFSPDVDDAVMIQIMLEETGQNEYWSFLGYTMDVQLDSVIPKT